MDLELYATGDAVHTCSSQQPRKFGSPCVIPILSIDAAMHQEFIERERVYDFLVGLNVELDQVRVQIHGKEPLPSLNEAFAIVKGEGRRNIMLKKGNTIDNFALAISKPSGNEEVLATNAANSGRNEGKKTSEEDSLWCSYCKKNRHTRETCWKLHGKPLNFFKGNGGKGVNYGYKSQANLAEIGGKQQEESFGQEMELNKEEIDKLKRFISKLEKPEGHSHFAQIGKYSFSLSASKIQFSSPWIIDSGASDLTTNSSKVFSNYIPCSGNQKIKIADGTLVTVNLLTGKVIGHAREGGGLFLLEAESGTTYPTHTNKKSFVPFSLIHTDVWGPSKVHSISGGEPFAEDKEFFPSLPTLPILENSTKTLLLQKIPQKLHQKLSLSYPDLNPICKVQRGRIFKCHSRSIQGGSNWPRNSTCPVIQPEKATNLDWPLQQLDVKNAFLHGDLKEEVYMKVPLGGLEEKFEQGRVCKVNKALYGLKQSPRAWFRMGYNQRNDPAEMKKLKRQLAKEFEIKDLGKLKYFLGIEVAHSNEGIVILQHKYILDLLKEIGMSGCKSGETPIEQSHKLNEGKGSTPVNKERYQYLVGKLIYLAHTKPDIAYVVSDRRSTSGYCTFLGGNLVTWRSKKESVVARSSVEVEFRAMAHGISIGIAHNPVQHDRNKHVEEDQHFIEEKLENGLIFTPYIPTKGQLADILTKGLPTR
ncbi:Retrovirus-related Pol polyprotein from transposon RE1 [Vitis vinifera]|uniref:Retrovirus-related Pol polyprotein from transposon RE1 n=1 Tax=Vitis vinifera TaxID=29760 RepID=A0A438G237_VITVI|nr:Retrovirus-related Pol polyprotein from transposon RE1 [Vitis vinifera]